MLKKLVFSALALTVSFSAGALEVGKCDFLDSIGYLQDTKTYYNGDVRVAYVDTAGEPVCCSAHVLIFVPAEEGIGSTCFAISATSAKSENDAALGVSSIDFKKIKSSYGPLGLELSIPYWTYDPNGGQGDKVVGKVRINLSAVEKVSVIR